MNMKILMRGGIFQKKYISGIGLSLRGIGIVLKS